MDRTVSSNPFIYDPIKGLGVSASIWDDVLDELFDEPFGNVPDRLVFSWMISMGRLDLRGWTTPDLKPFPDHDYVRNLLRQSIEELSSDPQLPNDDGSDCDQAIAEYWAHRPLSTEAHRDIKRNGAGAGKLV